MSDTSEKTTVPPQPYFVMMPPPAADDDEISLVDLLRVLLRHKWLIFAITFMCTAGAVAYALVTTPIYRADVRFTLVLDRENAWFARSSASTLESRQFIIGFITERNLKPILFPENWDPERKNWIVGDSSLVARIKRILLPDGKGESSEQLTRGEPTMWDAYNRFYEALTVIDDSKTGLVTVQVDWKDPKLAAKWANALFDRLKTERRQKLIKESERAIQDLSEQVQQGSLANLNTVFYGIIKEHISNISRAKASGQFPFELIDPAVPPQHRISPKRTRLVIVGFFIGLILGMLAAFLQHFVRQYRQSAER